MNSRKKYVITVVCLLAIIIFYQFSKTIYTVMLNNAIQSGDKAKVEKLISLGGDLNHYYEIRIAEYSGKTPLQEACILGDIEIITLLLNNGANINTEEWTHLTLVLTNDSPQKYEILELLFAKGATISTKEEFLMDNLLNGLYDSDSGGIGKLSPNVRNTKDTFEVMLLLIENGIDIKKQTKDYQERNLGGAIQQGNFYIVEYLVETGNYDINMSLYRSNTPLIEATEYDNKQIIEYLLLQGADKEIRNDEGKTALDIAKENDYQEIVEMLE